MPSVGWYTCSFKTVEEVLSGQDASGSRVDLSDRMTALSNSISRGDRIPAGRVMGFPELPGGDMWCDIAGAAAIVGVPPKTITGWLARGGPKDNPFPIPNRILYRLYWPISVIRKWQNG